MTSVTHGVNFLATSQWANRPDVNISTQNYSSETYEGPALPPDVIAPAVPNQYLITPWNALSNLRVTYPYQRDDYHLNQSVLTNSRECFLNHHFLLHVNNLAVRRHEPS
jgi:hypothetical protein